MRKFQQNGKKFVACLLAICMITGVITGLNICNSTDVIKAATGFTNMDFLKCDGTYIKNNYGKGNNVYLRGTNAGGWLVQESWMNATNVRDQKTLMSNLESRFGTNKMYELLDVYESNYWTETDFDNCKNMGMSVIRLPFTYMNLYRYDNTQNDWVLRSDAFNRLDWFVNNCSERGIYVILDLHGAFGSQNGQDHSGEVIDNVSNVTFFSNSYYKNKTLELWKTVAAHYAGNPAVAAYDTLNEPGEKAGSTNAKHWAFYDQMYDAIRSVDGDHIIIMESCWGTGNLPNPKSYGWENVMYEYHHYTWDYISDLAGQKTACDNLIKNVNNANYGVPTYIGEFTCFGLEEAWDYVMDKFNNAGWHYTSWSYKTTNSGSWGIYNEKTTSKVNPTSDSEETIRSKWGADSIGTGSQSSSGMVYNALKAALPGTVVMADKALTDSDYIKIKATINNKYVCADNYGESVLAASRDTASEWEQFRIIKNSDGTISLQSRANNKYLCAVFDDTDKENPVIARSNAIGTWEKFYLEKQNDGTYALKTFVNNYYIQADINDSNSGVLHAIGASVGTWERLSIEAVSGSLILPGEEPTTPEPTTQAPVTTNVQNDSVTEIPGTVKVDSYTDKTDSITFSSTGNIRYAGNLINGSYLDYSVKANQTGEYILNLGLAAGDVKYNAKNIIVKINDAVVATIPVTASSSWTTFISHTAKIYFTSSGTYKLSISSDGGACNITDFTLTKVEEVSATQGAETTSNTVSSENAPIEVFGLVVNNDGENAITVVWGQNQSQIALNQKYNVYVDGEKKLSKVDCGAYRIDGLEAGNRTIKVTATIDGNETSGTEAVINVTGSVAARTPIEVFGLVVNNEGNSTITVVWGQNQSQIALNQKYNVYVDGEKKLSNVECAAYTLGDIAPGDRTIRVTAVVDGNESIGAATVINVTQ